MFGSILYLFLPLLPPSKTNYDVKVGITVSRCFVNFVTAITGTCRTDGVLIDNATMRRAAEYFCWRHVSVEKWIITGISVVKSFTLCVGMATSRPVSKTSVTSYQTEQGRTSLIACNFNATHISSAAPPPVQIQTSALDLQNFSVFFLEIAESILMCTSCWQHKQWRI